MGKHLTLDVSCVSVLKPLTKMMTMMTNMPMMTVMTMMVMVMVMRSRDLLDAFLSFPRSRFISELR